MHCWAIIAAAGSGTRLAKAGLDGPKQFLQVDGVPLYWLSARTFAAVPLVRGIVFVFPSDAIGDQTEAIERLAAREDFPLPWRVATGGAERRDSVRNGLLALPWECDAVLVHDAARPFVSPGLAARVAAALADGARAVIPGVAVKDTIREVDPDGRAGKTLIRDVLRAVQTPQGFTRQMLALAHERALEQDVAVTDDAALMDLVDVPVLMVAGEETNRKITTPEDLSLLRTEEESTMTEFWPRTGFGYDVHAYGGTRPLVLGGVPIPGDVTVRAHSDGDVLLHALIDAILGCCGRGDIGALFPDNDPRFDGIESGVLLAETLRLAGPDLRLVHADLTVVAQKPKIAPFRERIAANVATLLGLPRDAVNVKATTEEGLGFTGEKKGIKAYAVVTAMNRSAMFRQK